MRILRQNTGVDDLPGSGENELDAVERVHGKPEDTTAAEGRPEGDGSTAKLIRLPHRPRRRTWQPEGGTVFDPAPTRPVLRSELQSETGTWPVDPGAADHEGSVIDLGASRRKRAGNEAAGAGIRRLAKPRRIGPDTSG